MPLICGNFPLSDENYKIVKKTVLKKTVIYFKWLNNKENKYKNTFYKLIIGQL